MRSVRVRWTGSDPGDVVRIEGGTPTVVDSELDGGPACASSETLCRCISIATGANPRIEGNKIHGCRVGVLANRNARVELLRNDIFGNSEAGLAVYGGARPRAEANRIGRNGVGIWLAQEGAGGEFLRNDLRGNRRFAWDDRLRANQIVKRGNLE